MYAASAAMVFGEINGAPSGSSGAPGDDTCTACHGGRPNTGQGRVRVVFNENNSFTAGQTVRMQVTVEDPNARRWGFQLAARLDSNPQSPAGRLASSDGNTRVLNESGLQWITHTAAGTRPGSSGSATFQFDWTAPDTAAPVTFFVAANAANNNGASTGDLIYTTTLKAAPAAAGGPRPAVTAGSITEAATGRAGLAAGLWATLSGTDLAGQEATWSPSSSVALPTTLAGVSVRVNDTAAALAFVSPTRITFLVPAGTPQGDAAVTVDRDGQRSAPVNISASVALPAIFSVPDPAAGGRFYAAATTAGGGAALALVNPRGWILSRPEVDSRATRGALPGEEIELYAVGLGATEPTFSTTRLPAGPAAVTGTVNVRFGGTSVAASSAVLISSGVYVVRVRVPESAAPGDVPVVIESNGVSSGENVVLFVQSQ